MRTLATLGLAVSGPVTLLSGLVTFATIPRGVPPAIAAIFVVALAATVLSLALYVTDDLRRR
jgi:hypothetical protein